MRAWAQLTSREAQRDGPGQQHQRLSTQQGERHVTWISGEPLRPVVGKETEMVARRV